MAVDMEDIEDRQEIPSVLVQSYAKLWPREIFYMEKTQPRLKESLGKRGVYVLYLDFDVFYIGKADNLYRRLCDHATKRYSLWNHFSVFAVDNPDNVAEVEAILIAATPRTANRNGGKLLKRIPFPAEIQSALDKSRRKQTANGAE